MGRESKEGKEDWVREREIQKGEEVKECEEKKIERQ